jgi:hypothetical protein
VKPFVPTIDRKDLISEADLDEIEDDDTYTDFPLEDVDALYSYVVVSKDSWE